MVSKLGVTSRQAKQIKKRGGNTMASGGMTGAIARAAVLAVLLAMPGGARAFDDSNYPDLKGMWTRAPVPGIGLATSFDPTKRAGRAQQAPLTPEYQKIFEDNLAEQAAGGHGIGLSHICIPPGMPGAMTVFEPMEIIITGDTTHITVQSMGVHRRIYTDGRDWPAEVEPAWLGYSIGKWLDEDGDGRLDTLVAETRHMKGPRVYDPTGLPLHADNETVIHERIHLDKTNPNLLHDEMTVIDNALTRPWSADKIYQRNPNPRPVWREEVCQEGNPHVRIGGNDYMVSADGLLMPSKKDQAPPDLRYFKASKK
jgi:hypothetical protein